MTDINSFTGPYRFLSNFEGPEVKFGDLWFPRVENAYQAAKTLKLDIRKQFANSNMTAAEAKKLGNTVELRPGWFKIRWAVMNICVRQKFLDRTYLEKLIATGSANLIEGNRWHDNYWGVCSCLKCANEMKYNSLGHLLMSIREEMEAWKVCFEQQWALNWVLAGPK